MAKILIIEDEANIRKVINYNLKQQGHLVFEAETGSEGLNLALTHAYDIILVDWMLPQISGIEIIEKLRLSQVNSIIIMITAKAEEFDLLQAFEAGADDYLTKPFSHDELCARISAHLRRYKSMHSQVQLEDIVIDDNYKQVFFKDQNLNLTKKEYELFLYLVDNRDQLLSRNDILRAIWQFEYDGDTRIVDVHIFKLRNKLKESSYKIKTIRGLGYAFQKNS